MDQYTAQILLPFTKRFVSTYRVSVSSLRASNPTGDRDLHVGWQLRVRLLSGRKRVAIRRVGILRDRYLLHLFQCCTAAASQLVSTHSLLYLLLFSSSFPLYFLYSIGKFSVFSVLFWTDINYSRLLVHIKISAKITAKIERNRAIRIHMYSDANKIWKTLKIIIIIIIIIHFLTLREVNTPIHMCHRTINCSQQQ